MKSLDFSWLQGGYCNHPKRMTLKSATFSVAKYPSHFAIIKHPSLGIILYDTGYTDDFEQATRKLPEKLYALLTPVQCSGEDNCIFKLKEKGIEASDVSIVIISHFHADHVCGLKHFTNAKFYFFKFGLTQLQNLNKLRRVASGFLDQLIPDDIFERMVDIDSCKNVRLPVSLKPFETGFDLIGDQSLMAIPLPGHMQGHTGLFLTTDDQEIFIIGDAAWHTESIRENVGPSSLVRIITSNWNAYSQTILDLHNLMKNNKELIILPSHCTEHQGKFS